MSRVTHVLADLFAVAGHARQTKFRAKEKVRGQIATGENPFYKWREFYHGDLLEVADALDLTVREYNTIESNEFSSTRSDVRAFCRLFKLNPMDLANDVDVMPGSVAEVLTERARDRGLTQGKRDKAVDAIVMEIGKTRAVFAQAKLHALRGRTGQEPVDDMILPFQALEQMTLGHPLVRWVENFGDVRNMLEETAFEADMMLLGAGAELDKLDAPHMAKGQNRRLKRMRAFYAHLDDRGSGRMGEALTKVLRTRGFAFVARDFQEDPGRYGGRRWYAPRIIGGRVYDWDQACEAFFDTFREWRGHQVANHYWHQQEDRLTWRMDAFEDWLERDVTQDVIQGFTNVCLFARTMEQQPKVQAALAAFRPTRHAVVQERVFKGLGPC